MVAVIYSVDAIDVFIAVEWGPVKIIIFHSHKITKLKRYKLRIGCDYRNIVLLVIPLNKISMNSRVNEPKLQLFIWNVSTCM